ncbi:MAG: hypothetical protein RBT06_10045, partial [Smithellaceae bacterium]|nr:hypothetical protein [Smithellaceae bacterium]
MMLKSIKTKKKVRNSSSVLVAQKRKDIEHGEEKRANHQKTTGDKLFGKVIACVVIAGTVMSTYIYIERQAQAAFDGQGRSRLMMFYELYNSAIFADKKKVIADVLLNSGVEETLSLQIAQAVVEESKKTNIPMQMYLAIMKTESTFRP